MEKVKRSLEKVGVSFSSPKSRDTFININGEGTRGLIRLRQKTLKKNVTNSRIQSINLYQNDGKRKVWKRNSP